MRRFVLYCNHPQEQDKWKVPLALQDCLNPDCRRVGCLIRNGALRGYGEDGHPFVPCKSQRLPIHSRTTWKKNSATLVYPAAKLI